MQRRRFLHVAAGTAASSALVSCSKPGAGRLFSASEIETLNAVAGRIVPTDDAPGARETGASQYIDRQLSGILKKHLKSYRQGLIGLDHVSQAQHGKRFAALEAADQDRILALCEAGSTDPALWRPAEARDFFNLVRDHVMQSFYGDPRHGGNREYASWRMLGVPPAPLRGRRNRWP